MENLQNGSFATRLKELRIQSGKTQSTIANELDITQSAFSAYEKGDRLPSYEVLISIAKIFNVSLDWLCGLSDEKKQNDVISTYSDLMKLLFQVETPKMHFRRDLIVTTKEYGEARYACIGFDDPVIEFLFQTWEKTYSLYKEKTIDETIYTAWKEKIYKDFKQEFLGTIGKIGTFNGLNDEYVTYPGYESVLERLKRVNTDPFFKIAE